MNIAEYIEQHMANTSYRITVFYHKFAKDVGLKDVRTAKEWIESDLQALFQCRYIHHGQYGSIYTQVLTELFFNDNYVQIDFSHCIYQLRKNNPHWLSDTLQKAWINNYIVKGD